jgi:DNA-binding transcriptional ArsR family regulator
MSIESISWALNLEDDRLTAVDRLVLIGVANHDGDGGAWPAVATLARYAGVAPRSVSRSLSRLEDLGLLVRHQQQGGNSRTRADQRPNLYELVKTRDDTPVTPSGERDDTPVTPRDDTTVTPPLTDRSPEPSIEPSTEPSTPPVVPQGGPVEVVDPWIRAFDSWWTAYPRKVGKPVAFRAFKKKVAKMSTGQMLQCMNGTKAWIEHWKLVGTEEQFIPHPSTFLNQERYNDPIPAKTVKKESGMDALRRLAERDQEAAS